MDDVTEQLNLRTSIPAVLCGPF